MTFCSKFTIASLLVSFSAFAQPLRVFGPISFASSQDGTKAALFGYSSARAFGSKITVFKPSNETIIFESEVPGTNHYSSAHLEFSKDASSLLVAASSPQGALVEVLNAVTGAVKCEVSQTTDLVAGAILPSGSKFAIVTKNSIKIFNLSDCAIRQSFPLQIAAGEVTQLEILSNSSDRDLHIVATRRLEDRRYKTERIVFSVITGKYVANVLEGVPSNFNPDHIQFRPGSNEIWLLGERWVETDDTSLNWHDFNLIVVDVSTGHQISSTFFGGAAFATDTGLKVSNDGARVIATTGWGLYSFDGATKAMNASYNEAGCQLLNRSFCSDDDATVSSFVSGTSNEIMFAGTGTFGRAKF